MTVIHTVAWKIREGDAAAAALVPACAAAVEAVSNAGIDGVEKPPADDVYDGTTPDTPCDELGQLRASNSAKLWP
ncbi:hypothetical protein HK405_009919 [Cladochytrium tenue]|nr:hypothetical protein HK405_009919 [Cladochytrium tenue]